MRQMSACSLAISLTVALGCSFEDKIVTPLVEQEQPDADASDDADAGETDTDSDAGPEPIVCESYQTVDAVQGFTTSVDRNPINIHMTFESDPATEMTFQWATTEPREIGEAVLDTYTPMVWIVPEDRALDGAMGWCAGAVITGTGEIFRETLLGETVGIEDSVTWTVRVTGLSPRTRYIYRVGTSDGFNQESGVFINPDFSAPYTVTTGRTKGDDSAMTLVMAGDSRGGTGTIRDNMEAFLAAEAEVWFFNGDMTNGGTMFEWHDWMDAMQPILATRPLMPVQGNHEVFANVYYKQFALPVMPGLPPEYIEHAWGLTYGNVHVVGLNSNTQAVVEEQVAWLDAHLAQVSVDPEIDWIIALMHHPPYSSSSVHGSTTRLQEHWVPVFETHGVDLVFAGHDHNYERSHPIRGTQVMEDGAGVVYVVAGAFGSPGYSNGESWWTVTSTHGDVGNYVITRFEGRSMTLTAYDITGSQVLDTFTMSRK